MAEKAIKAILFDLGETLLIFGQVDTLSLFKQAGRLSYDYLKNKSHPVGNFKFYLWRNILQLYLRRMLANITGNDFDSLKVIKKYGAKMGLRLTDKQWEHVNWLWYTPLRQKSTIEPNLIETLTKLKQSGLKLGVISNTFVNACSLDRHLKEEGLLDFFDMRMYSYQYNCRKPDKRIFIEAAQRIGFALNEIMFVGDRIDTDIKGAIKANMLPVLIKAHTNNGRLVPNGVERIQTVSELPDLIEKINRQK